MTPRTCCPLEPRKSHCLIGNIIESRSGRNIGGDISESSDGSIPLSVHEGAASHVSFISGMFFDFVRDNPIHSSSWSSAHQSPIEWLAGISLAVDIQNRCWSISGNPCDVHYPCVWGSRISSGHNVRKRELLRDLSSVARSTTFAAVRLSSAPGPISFGAQPPSAPFANLIFKCFPLHPHDLDLAPGRLRSSL
jgi:hypothetical protein